MKYNISKPDFDLLEEVVLLYQPYKAGMPWQFAGSFYYATTVLTTIGYGHSTPETDLIVVAGTLTLFVATCGAAVFSYYEEWSYLHAIYYGFTTLTTIGFGDYVALQQDNSLQQSPEYVTFV